MKKSNIFILVATGFVITASVLLFVLNKRYEQPKEPTKPVHMVTHALQPFQVLIANEGADVHIEQADSNRISIETSDGKSFPAGLYTQTGDTLTIEKGVRVFVNCSSIATIISNKAYWMGAHSLKLPHLNIRMNGGLLRFNVNETVSKVTVLDVQLSDSARFDIRRTEIDSLNLSMTGKSFAEMYAPVKKLNLEMYDHSHLITNGEIELMQIKKDSSIRLEFVNN